MIYQGDCLKILKELPDKSVHCCVTSPPYWGLRDYGSEGQLGLEKTPEEYISKMIEVFKEVKRVLRDDGTLWLNLGDSYAGSCQTGGTNSISGKGKSQPHVVHKREVNRTKDRSTDKWSYSKCSSGGDIKPKDLVGIPWLVAFALRADGWYLRQDIIWSKPNPMPESVTDRCAKSHEYIFLLTKSAKYYYDSDAIKEPLAQASIARLSQDIDNQNGSECVPFKTNGNMKAVVHKSAITPGQTPQTRALKRMNGEKDPEYLDRNKRSVWIIPTMPFKAAHFATFPEDLIEPCILAGCPQGGVCLDPFFGAGTTGVVAKKNMREFIGIELNPEYIKIAEQRIKNTDAVFL